MKTGSIIMLAILGAVLFMMAFFGVAGIALKEVRDAGGLRPVLAEIWCGDKACMDKGE